MFRSSSILNPLFLLTLLLLCNAGQAQWPYNPNADGDSLIGTGDILGLLTIYGMPWDGEGVLGIESGGTGAESAAAARDSLGLSFISDSTTIQGINTYVWTWVEDDFRVTGQILYQ